jgi:hypothetical protein
MKAYLQSRRLMTIAIIVICCVVLVGAGLWKTKTLWAVSPDLSNSQNIKVLNKEGIKRGIGSSVKFMPPTAGPDVIGITVDQTASFIHSRSGLAMGAETRRILAQMEGQVSKSNSNRDISAANLTDALADTMLERVATLTDQELKTAGKLFRNSPSAMQLRANGEYELSAEEFDNQAKSLRKHAKDKSSVAHGLVRAFVEEEVNDRFTILSEALPDQFGKAFQEGVTPTQALLVTYSVITDDGLEGSQSDLNNLMKTVPGAPAKGCRVKNGWRDKNPEVYAFGIHGRVFSTPANLFFNKETMNSFLKRLEKARVSK